MRGRGLLSSQSLLTIKKGTSPFSFQSNKRISKFLRQQMAIPKILIYAFRENTRCNGGIHPLITLNLKKGTRTSDFQSNELPPKFIRSPFPYKLVCPPYMPGITYNSCPEICRGGGVILQDKISVPCNSVEHNG